VLETARWNAANTARSSIRLRQMCSLGHASLHLPREAQPHTLAASEQTASITYLVGFSKDPLAKCSENRRAGVLTGGEWL